MLCCDIERRAGVLGESHAGAKLNSAALLSARQQLLFVRAPAADNKTFHEFSKFVFYAHGGGEPRVGACLWSAQADKDGDQYQDYCFETCLFSGSSQVPLP